MTAGSFKLKTLMILSFLLIWAVIAAAHVFYYAVATRGESLAESRKIAWREAEIPALRGRILDRNGIPAAWSELHHNLILESLPESRRRRNALQRFLQRDFPAVKLPHSLKEPLVLKADLAPDEIVRYSKRVKNLPEVRIVPVILRMTVANPEARRMIGATAWNEAGELVGVSGLEKEHDMTLSGRSGRMRVMLDRYGNWCYDTLRVLEQPENGRDVNASFELRIDPETQELLNHEES